MQKKSRDEQDDLGVTLISALKGLAAGIITALALSLIFTAVSLGMDDPEKLLGVFALVTLFVGAAAGGLAAGIFERGRTAGILSGAGYVLVVWILSLFFRNGGGLSPVFGAVGYVICVALSFLAGVITGRGGSSVNRKSPTAARRKKAMRRQ